jgi:hypothetical protein
MNEMELLTRLRDEVPREVSARAAELFATGISGAQPLGRPTRRSPASALRAVTDARARWRLATAGGVAGVLAAGATLAATGALSTSSPRPTTVAELAYRAATAAESQPGVRPGQWVYRKLYAKPGTPWLPQGVSPQWATADNTKNAFFFHGKLIVGPWSSWAPLGCTAKKPGAVPVPVPCAPGQQKYLKFPVAQEFITYRQLSSLPASPHALITALADRNPHGYLWMSERLAGAVIIGGFNAKSRAFRAFNVISYLLATYVMPPRLTAELYRALGDIPGIELYQHATDVAGQHGLGFVLRSRTDPSNGEMIILNPSDYRFMAFGDQSYGVAVLQQMLVSGPGVTP